jgi:hypothetical protein
MSGKPYRCPVCPRKSLTRPRMMLHVWSHALSAEAGLDFDAVEEFLVRHYAEGKVRVDAKTGDVTPVGSWSELGAVGKDIVAVLGDIEEENRREREERRAKAQEELEEESA